MAKFNVGDKLRVISKETMRSHNGAYYMSGSTTGEDILTSMTKYCGEVVTVSEYTTNGTYSIEEDGKNWNWTDEMFEGKIEPQFSKSDLKNGMRVEFEDGAKCLMFDGKMLRFLDGRYWTDICNYDENLNNLKPSVGFKIVKVYDVPSNPSNILKSYELGELLWERPTKVTLTPKQIADKFGISEKDLVIKTSGEIISDFQF